MPAKPCIMHSYQKMRRIELVEKHHLTEAEKKRQSIFDALCEELKQNGYEETDLIATSKQANVLGVLYAFLLSVPFIVLFFIIHWKNYSSLKDFHINLLGLWIFVAVMFISIVVHELIHGLVWSLSAKKHWKSIEFGIIWKSLNPYCTCSEPLKKGAYIAGLIMPGIVLGIIPTILAIIIGQFYMMLFGVIFIVAAGGDLFVLGLILKHKAKPDALYFDHPTQIGLVCFER